MIQPGTRVICVDDTIPFDPPERLLSVCELFPNWVKEGQRYTIREIGIALKGDNMGVLLEEISNPIRDDIIIGLTLEPAFSTLRFRELTPEEKEEDSLSSEDLFKHLMGPW